MVVVAENARYQVEPWHQGSSFAPLPPSASLKTWGREQMLQSVPRVVELVSVGSRDILARSDASETHKADLTGTRDSSRYVGFGTATWEIGIQDFKDIELRRAG